MHAVSCCLLGVHDCYRKVHKTCPIACYFEQVDSLLLLFALLQHLVLDLFHFVLHASSSPLTLYAQQQIALCVRYYGLSEDLLLVRAQQQHE